MSNDYPELPPRCTQCSLGEQVTLREPDFGVAYASYQECEVCGWALFSDWAATRSGSADSWVSPKHFVEWKSKRESANE